MKRERIITLDLLRGYFLIAIVINHLGLFPSPFEFITGRGVLWASAAEGFFLISGLLAGYIYTPRLLQSFRRAATKIWRRAGVLYFWAVLIAIVTVLWGNALLPGDVRAGLWVDPSSGQFIYQVLTLQYTYGWADFLRYYAVYMLFAPLVLWLCTRRLAWLALLGSFGLWLVSSNFWQAWQLLFVLGIVGGYYLPVLERRYRSLRPTQRTRLLFGFVAATVMTVIFSALCNRVAVFFTETYGSLSALPQWLQAAISWLYGVRAALQPLTDKDSLGTLRLCVALLWFATLYLVVRHHEHTIDRFTRGWLRTLGSYSLLVYVSQALLVYGVLAVLPPRLSILANTLITVLAIVVLYLVVRCYPGFVKTLGGLMPGPDRASKT